MLSRPRVLPPSLVHLTNYTCISVTTNIGWPILAAREADLNAANCLASACWRSIEACDYYMGPAPCLKMGERLGVIRWALILKTRRIYKPLQCRQLAFPIRINTEYYSGARDRENL